MIPVTGMRRFLFAAIGLIALVGASAFARDHLTLDAHFTVCPWGDLKRCELLDAQKERSLGLTKQEADHLRNLRIFADSSGFSDRDLVNAFGKPKLVAKDSDALSLTWYFPDGTSERAPSLGLILIDHHLSVIQYLVPKKFSIFWGYSHLKPAPKKP